MITTDTVRSLYHAYLYDALDQNLEPVSFTEWYDTVFVGFLAGRELVLHAVN